MEIIKTVKELRAVREDCVGTVGLTPTMGYLHEGHLSLIRQARAENCWVFVSIFVNPLQFGPNEDLEKYPRDLARDSELAREAGADVLFVPEAEELYPPGYSTYVNVEGPLTARLCGAARPGHFRGVTTVVAKLFNLIQPHRAYFGQKDAQQAQVIRRMVADLHFPLEIRVLPIVREADGLALSSRNTYLNPEEREAAPVLYRALQAAAAAFQAGEREAGKLREEAIAVLRAEPRARIEYVELVDAETLLPLEGEIEGKALLALAVWVGKTRLIDNIILNETE